MDEMLSLAPITASSLNMLENQQEMMLKTIRKQVPSILPTSLPDKKITLDMTQLTKFKISSIMAHTRIIAALVKTNFQTSHHLHMERLMLKSGHTTRMNPFRRIKKWLQVLLMRGTLVSID